MAVQGTGVTTLMDVLTELDPGGKQLDIAEVLTQQNEVLADMHWEEGNSVTGHKDAMRTVLPTPSFRAINSGVPVTKAGSTPVEETCALLEDFSQVDRELAVLSGDVNKFRLRQATPHVQGMSNKQALTLFYGNAGTNPLEYTGFAPRFNSLNTSTNKAAGQIIDAGGTGSNLRSIWLVGWGPNSVFGIYPKGTKGGLAHEDVTNASGEGEHGFPAASVLQDANGNMYMGYRDHWVWRCGLFVKDWRYVVRIANIDMTALTLNEASGPKLEDLMIQAEEQIESTTGVRAVFYMPRAIRAYMRRQINNKKAQYTSWEEVGGQRLMKFGDTTIRRTDALNTAETRVV
jgi:hypothetical protein